MEIIRNGTQPTIKGPKEWFTGEVSLDPQYLKPFEPSRNTAATVRFEPSARTAWHTHPLGQTLIITGGKGRVQREGEGVEEVYPGDVVWFAPGEKHWHGASPTTFMTHIAVQEEEGGTAVEWMEHVSDEDFLL